jgi:hypothetical protein
MERTFCDVIFHPTVGPPTANRFQPFWAYQVSYRRIINHAKFYVGRLTRFGLARINWQVPENRMFPYEKHVVFNEVMC